MHKQFQPQVCSSGSLSQFLLWGELWRSYRLSWEALMFPPFGAVSSIPPEKHVIDKSCFLDSKVVSGEWLR
jgi:hypothetical protein